MKIYIDLDLENFDFWSGARKNAELLTSDELDEIGARLGELYPEGLSETQLNEFFWFGFDWLCELIGLEYDAKNDKIIRGGKIMKYVHHERTKDIDEIVAKIKEMHKQAAAENCTVADLINKEPKCQTLKKLFNESCERVKALQEVLSLFDIEIRF